MDSEEFKNTLMVAIPVGLYLYEHRHELKDKNEKIFIAEALVYCSEKMDIELNSSQCSELFKSAMETMPHLKELK